jgi:2-dehydro-3-deoxy-D-arabinonate dehydratase
MEFTPMSKPQLIRYHHPQSGAQVAVVVDGKVYDLPDMTIATFLQQSVGRIDSMITRLVDMTRAMTGKSLDNLKWLPPLDSQEVWAAGVTYMRSREARQEEAQDGGDVYARVYDAERPEIFFKASAKNTVGHGDEVGIRQDSKWNVPEPELAVVLNPAMEVVGFTVGNDMSSRDIEGENPLYLPQAKVYTASCALGTGIVLSPSDTFPDTNISISISRAGSEVFADSIHTSRIKRTIAELVMYLGRSNSFPFGVILLTGTGIVPSADFTLQAGDVVTITIDDIGTLQNTVKVV